MKVYRLPMFKVFVYKCKNIVISRFYKYNSKSQSEYVCSGRWSEYICIYKYISYNAHRFISLLAL